MSEEIFDDSASSCAIDCLSILCKKVDQGLDFISPPNDEEIQHIYDTILTGEASRSDLESATTLLSLWLVVLRIIKIVQLPEDGDYSNIPVHIARFYGAMLSTFEILFEANPNFSENLLIGLESAILPPNTLPEDFIVQLLKEYKDWFPYSYMFNRRVGKYPKSCFDIVNRYYKTKVQNRDNINSHPQTILDISDEDTYKDEADDDTLGDSLNQDSFPNLLPPNVAPIKPFSDPGFNLIPNTDISHDPSLRLYQSDSDPSDPSSLTPNEASILNSYYLNWKTPVEEDEDSDDNQYFQNLKPKRVTRMKASIRKGKKLTRRKLDDVSSYTSEDLENRIFPGVPKSGSKSVSFADDSQSQNLLDDAVEEFVNISEVSSTKIETLTSQKEDSISMNNNSDNNLFKDSSNNSESSLDLSDQEKNPKGKINSVKDAPPINEIISNTNINTKVQFNSSLKISNSPVIKEKSVLSDEENNSFLNSNQTYSIDRVTSDSVSIQPSKGIDTWAFKGSHRYRNPLDWSLESSSSFPGHDNFIPSSTKKSALSNNETLLEQQENMLKPTLNPRSPSRELDTDKPSYPSIISNQNHSKPLPKSFTNQDNESGVYMAKYISDDKFAKLKQRIKQRKEQQNFSVEKVKSKHFHPTSKETFQDPKYYKDQHNFPKNELGRQKKLLDVSPATDPSELYPESQNRIQAATSKSLRFSQEFPNPGTDKVPSPTVPSLSEYNRFKYFSDPMNLRGNKSVDANRGAKLNITNVSNSIISNSPDNKLPELKRIVSLDLRQKPSAQPTKEFVTLSIQSNLAQERLSAICPSPSIPDLVELRESQDFLEESKIEIPPMSELVSTLASNIDSILGYSFKDLPNNLQLPSPSEIALSSGIIIEDYVFKKSSILGLWKKKYFVLRESSECFCKLEIYNKAIESNWGYIPLSLKTVIPIQDIASVESIGSKGTQGKEFMINFHAKKGKSSSFSLPFFKSKKSPLSQSSLQFENISDSHLYDNDANSDAGSLASEGFYGTNIKQIQIQCNSSEERLLWVTIFNKILLLAEAVQNKLK